MTRAACGCRVGGWSGHLTANGSCYDFPGRQACAVFDISRYLKKQKQNIILRLFEI